MNNKTDGNAAGVGSGDLLGSPNLDSDEAANAAVEALKAIGVELQVGGCGCCGSPWARIRLHGKMLYDGEGRSFGAVPNIGDDPRP